EQAAAEEAASGQVEKSGAGEGPDAAPEGASFSPRGREGVDDELLARTDGRGVPRGRILMYLHIDAADLWPGGLGSGPAPSTREELERIPVRVEGGGIPAGTIVTADQLAPMFYRPS